MHVVSVDPKVVKAAIDQGAEVGFEMVILTFGSGLNMENASDRNCARMKELADYAHSKGIELGGYSLLASRSVGPDDDVINPKTGKTGRRRDLRQFALPGEQVGPELLPNLDKFISKTGFTLLEHDGSYPGDVCASTKHPGHRGLDDSQWMQWRKITDFYRWCRARGVYLNVPDWYFLNGSTKTGMGYRETNWSLPREQQIIHGRQNIYDGTWEKTPSMGWMFVPLTQYQGGGAAATIEPLGRASRRLRGASGQQLRVRRAGLLPRPAALRHRRDEGRGEEVGGFLQEVPRHPRLRHHPRPPRRRPESRLHAARQSRAETEGAGDGVQPDGQAAEADAAAAAVLHGADRHGDGAAGRSAARVYRIDRQYNIEVEVEMRANGITWFVIE